MRALMLLATLLALPAAAQAPWDPRFYDPGGGADLILPLPCGGAMAFQKVLTPVDPTDPLDDRRIRLGGADPATGYVDYLQQTYLRGGFSDAATGEVFYYIARYEMTAGQVAALRGDCAAPNARGLLPAIGLSWFDAVDLTRVYTEWLRANAVDALPKEEGTPGYVRLPTEVEWEYAVRGGAVVSPSAFGERRFPMEGEIQEYAWSQGADSARGQLRPVGRLKPNPIGLYDVYGLAEEIMLDPFRVNNLGRPGGQVGGMVTRGGSIFSDAGKLYSAQRQEYPFFDVIGGKAQAQESFGARLVLVSHVTVSLERTNRLQEEWMSRLEAPPGAVDDPLAAVASLIEAETDPRQKALLENMRGLIAADRQRAQEAQLETLRALLVSGAVLTSQLQDDTRYLGNALKLEASTTAALASARETGDAGSIARVQKMIDDLGRAKAERTDRITLNGLSYERIAVTATRDYTPSDRRQAVDVLLLELEGSGRAGLGPQVTAFVADLDLFAADPAMGRDQLLRNALDP